MVEQKASMCSIRLGQLLEMKCGHLKQKLCEWLLERVDTARLMLYINGWELNLSAESFEQIMSISNKEMHVQIEIDMKEVFGYLERFEAIFRGINIKKLVEIGSRSNLDNNKFKLVFMLFALYSILSTGGNHISSKLVSFFFKEYENNHFKELLILLLW